MDRGTWTLRCQGCRKLFDLELKSGERIIQYAREAACPHCHNKPEELWHHIVGFRNVSTGEV